MRDRFDEDESNAKWGDCLDGASKQEMKRRYVKANAFGVDLGAMVYRILEVKYFLEDVKDQHITYKWINKAAWGDSSENPLFDQAYKDEVTSKPLTLNGVVDSFYGNCWSSSPLDSQAHWATFSRRRPSVRVRSTPRKLLDAVMSAENAFASLQHAIGRMRYQPSSERSEYFSDPDWTKHLDSQGHALMASFLSLDPNLRDEDEVRFLYHHLDVPWSREHVKVSHGFAKVPFDWREVIEEVVVGPFVEDGGEAKIRDQLLGEGINAPVTSSTTRVFRG